MAGIKSLSVRGIRSFGPDEGDEQAISFEKPLTLILGQNGCGKTTIIECLRYAITGQMPPGSRNECFVHDTKVSRSAEVLGQVKLKIMNAKDKELAVSRSMKVTQNQKKTRFQTLDSSLSVTDVNGETKDMSSRCADLDYVLQTELGVSKAILNYVIFCHQEDSSWPLDEGKKVKDRFDEIFDADKYSDCIDHLRKIRKDNSHTLKLLEYEVQNLTEKKQDLDAKKLSVMNTETEVSETEIKVAELTKDLKPVIDKLSTIKTLQNNLTSYEIKREKLKNRAEHCTNQMEELKNVIKNLFEGTKEELQETINNYSANAKAKKKDLEESYKKVMAFNKEEQKTADAKSANETMFNNFVLLESQNQERIDKKNGMIIDAAKIAEIEAPALETEEEAEKLINEVVDKITGLQKDLEDQKGLADEEEKLHQGHVDECRDALSRQKEKISAKETEIKNLKKETNKVEKQINDAEESKVKLESVEKKLTAAEEEYAAAEKELNTEECQKEINDDEKKMEEIEQELDTLNAKITKLQKQSAKLKERDMIEDSLRQKEKQIGVLKNKHRAALTELLGDMPQAGFALPVNKHELEARGQLDDLKKKIKQNDLLSTKLEAERGHVRSGLAARRAELASAEERLYDACGAASYGDTLAKLTATVDKLQDEQNILNSSMFIFAKYKSQLNENSCCPLCSRNFDSENEVTELVTQLTTQVMNVPSNLERVKEQLKKASTQKDDLLGMKSLNERVQVLKETEIPELETKLADLEQKIESSRTTSEQLSAALQEPEKRHALAKLLQPDMPLLDRYTAEIKQTSNNLEKVKIQIGEVDTSMTVEEATGAAAELRSAATAARARARAASTRLAAHNKRLHKLADVTSKLRDQKLNIQKKVQDLVNLQESLKQLEINREKCQAELKELQDEKPALDAALKQKQTDKAEIVNKNRAAIDVKRAYITKVTSAYDKVKSVKQEIKQHLDRNIPAEMERLRQANQEYTLKLQQLVQDRDLVTKSIDSMKDELAKQEIYKRDLDDNMKLRKLETDLENCQKDIDAINEKIGGIDTDLLAEKEPLMTQHENLFTEKVRTEGQLNQLKTQLAQSRAELKRAQSKNIEMKYRKKDVELRVARALDTDVRDYVAVLEQSLLQYHRGKMENINIIIREMWRKIYRGNDIDYIEIKTDCIKSDSDRRKYDYRVVQCKNGVEIDMRGRCSAGQKVLACLIIRLALAEAFSSRFGILALDEPTTNLDEENITSLCTALGEIVQERMHQKNFMFIIITHDKEFIDVLGNIDKVTHYYEVSRNDDGKSRVKKIRFL